MLKKNKMVKISSSVGYNNKDNIELLKQAGYKKSCYKFVLGMMKQAGYKRKDVSITSCCGGWYIETPKSKKEKSAHCKWCAFK